VVSPKVQECLRQASDSRRNAMQSADPQRREFWREIERKWLGLADNYQHAARTEVLLVEISGLWKS
jgi:hypothetical protein